MLLFPNAVHLVVLLAFACVYAFRHVESRPGRARYGILALLVWSYCLSTPRFANALLERLEQACPPAPPPQDSDPFILVLSSGSALKHAGRSETRLDLAGWERTWAAIRMWRQFGGRLLFVGGPTGGERSSVSEHMGEVARAAGVPSSAILVETRSRNTYENLLFNRRLLEGRKVWLVTSAVHMRRAVAVSRRLALEVQPAPCDYRAVTLQHWYSWLPNSAASTALASSLHELIGLMYYRWKGYAS